jgi:hypothetical protein
VRVEVGRSASQATGGRAAFSPGGGVALRGPMGVLEKALPAPFINPTLTARVPELEVNPLRENSTAVGRLCVCCFQTLPRGRRATATRCPSITHHPSTLVLSLCQQTDDRYSF